MKLTFDRERPASSSRARGGSHPPRRPRGGSSNSLGSRSADCGHSKSKPFCDGNAHAGRLRRPPAEIEHASRRRHVRFSVRTRAPTARTGGRRLVDAEAAVQICPRPVTTLPRSPRPGSRHARPTHRMLMPRPATANAEPPSARRQGMLSGRRVSRAQPATKRRRKCDAVATSGVLDRVRRRPAADRGFAPLAARGQTPLLRRPRRAARRARRSRRRPARRGLPHRARSPAGSRPPARTRRRFARRGAPPAPASPIRRRPRDPATRQAACIGWATRGSQRESVASAAARALDHRRFPLRGLDAPARAPRSQLAAAAGFRAIASASAARTWNRCAAARRSRSWRRLRVGELNLGLAERSSRCACPSCVAAEGKREALPLPRRGGEHGTSAPPERQERQLPARRYRAARARGVRFVGGTSSRSSSTAG